MGPPSKPVANPDRDSVEQEGAPDAELRQPTSALATSTLEHIATYGTAAVGPSAKQLSPVTTAPDEGPAKSLPVDSPEASFSNALPERPVASKADSNGTTQPTAGGWAVVCRVVPDELVELARTLWTTEVTYKAVRRYLGCLLAVGDPLPTTDEVARYLRASAKSARVQRARFPIAVACMPEEFADWLVRYRRMKMLPAGSARADPPATTASDAGETSLCGRDLAERAKEFCRRLSQRTSEVRSESQQTGVIMSETNRKTRIGICR